MVNVPPSPAVVENEFDLTNAPSANSGTIGAIAGVFKWGPVYTPTLVFNSNNLANTFGPPTNFNFETWWSAANFLAYSNTEYVTRVANTTGFANSLNGGFTNSTVFVILNSAVAGVSNSGLSVGNLILGPGVLTNTVVSVISSTGTNTTVTLSKGSANTSNNYLAFLSPNSAFTAIANSLPITDSLSLYNVGNTTNYPSLQPSFGTYANYLAKWPGIRGNSLKISQCDSANQFSANLSLTNWFGNTSANNTQTGLSFVVGNNQAILTVANNAGANDLVTTSLAGLIASAFTVGDYVVAGNNQTIGKQYLQINSISNVVTGNVSGTNTGIATFTLTFNGLYTLSSNISQSSVTRYWEYFNAVDKAPGQSTFMASNGNTAANDELHVVIADANGRFTGVPGTILEIWPHLSRANNAISQEGNQSIYYQTVINQQSKYIWWGYDRSTAVSNNALDTASSTSSLPLTIKMFGGADGDNESAVSFGTLAAGYQMYSSPEDIEVEVIITGKSVGGLYGEQLANYIYDNVISQRLDCMGVVSPAANTVVIGSGAVQGLQDQNIINFGNAVRFTDYLVIDTGYKYQWDNYNGVYRWIPLNADIGGCMAFTDQVRGAGFSPAGKKRGQIKNVTKLAFNPKLQDRNLLYQNSINPVITKSGTGTVLFGDKTHLGTNSAFSRINVRRIFNLLKKTIGQYSEDELFELNTAFTQGQFKAQITPLLRDAKATSQIADFKVICDGTNNTPEVLEADQFVGDIYIQPNYSINWVILNFIAVPPSVTFSEITGNFTG